MTLPIPSCEPSEFVAGDTVRWTKSLPDYAPTDGWALSYRVAGDEDGDEVTAGDISAIANAGGGWDVTILATATADLGGGAHRLFGWVTNGTSGERRVIHDREINVRPNVATVALADLLTDNQKVLAAIDARLAGRITADQEAVSINGTALTRIPIERLATLRGIYAAKVWREQHPGQSNPRHAMRFTSAR